MVLLPTNMTTLKRGGTHNILLMECMVLGGLIRNKIKGLIIDLSLFGLVWSLAKGSDWATQAILQFSIAQAALNFVEILFLQSPIPVSKHPLFLIVFQSPGFFNIFLTVL